MNIARIANSLPKTGMLFVMYMLQSIYTGFTWMLLPILMREQGIGLSEIGFSVLVYSPWALKFLYASQVDRWYIPSLGRRKSWFGPLIFLICAGLPLLAFLDPSTELKKILMVVFLLNICSSTADIAVDGYATDILAPGEMPLGNTVQMTGYWTGMLLGSGVFLKLYELSGWCHTLLIMASLYILLGLPVWLCPEIDPVRPADGKNSRSSHRERQPSVRAFVRTGTFRYFCIFLILSTLIMRGGSQLRLPMLVDLGFNASDIGNLMLYFGTPMSILGSLGGGVLVSRMGEGRVYIIGGILSAVVSLWSVWLITSREIAFWTVAGVFALEYLMMGGMMVLVYNLIMRVSVGPQSATNFAALCAVNHITMFCITALMGYVCDLTGYIDVFSGLTLAGILLIIPGCFLIRQRILTDGRQKE